MKSKQTEVPSPDHPNCQGCKLFEGCNSPFMSMEMDQPNALFIGEAPGCITGDSLIEVAYRDKSIYPEGIPIKDLVSQTDFYVYSYDVDDEKLVIGKVNKVWMTGVKPVYRVTYEWSYPDGKDVVKLQNSIKVTSGHPFLLRRVIKHDPFKGKQQSEDRYLSLEDDLMIGASLQPFLRRSHEYAHVGAHSRDVYRESRFLLAHKLGRPLKSREQCHHINRNRLDDSYDNITNLDISDHAALHEHEDGNPMDNPEVRKNHAKAVSSDNYRKNLSLKMQEVLSNPEVYEARLKQIQDTNEARSETVKRRFNEPGYYYNYLLGVQKSRGLDDQWLMDKFKGKFPHEQFPEDNHKIVSIEYVGIEPVYDMEVLEYHNFAVNGIFVHNSSEDDQNRPFVGKSGILLRGVIEDIGVNAAYTNAVRCRPVNNKTPTAKQMKLCRPFVLQDIEETNVETIVILGATALKSVLNESGVLEWRGSIVNKDDKNYFIALHPAAILWGRGSDETRTEWVTDMYRVAGIVAGETVEPADKHYEYIYVDSPDKAQTMLTDIREEGRCAMDLEFKWLEADRPKNAILVASFATSNKAWTIPIWHDESPFRDNDDHMFSILEVIDEICLDESIGKIGHNFKIDYLMVRLHLGIDIYGIEGDTMLLSQTIDSRPFKHGLKHLANRYLGMYGYDQKLEDYKKEHREADYAREWREDGIQKKGHYGNIPLDVLWLYAAKDAAATWLMEEKLIELATDQQLNIYRELMIPCISTFTEMELNGLKPDLTIAKKYKLIYEKEASRLLEELRLHDAVKKTEDDLNKDTRQQIHDLSEKLKEASIAVGLEKNKKKNEKLRKKAVNLKKRLESKKGKIVLFNPGSPNQVRKVIYEYMGFETDVKTPTGLLSASADVIRWFDDPWIDIYRLWRKYHDALSKYLNNIVKDWIGVDGRIRSFYNIVGAETGRTSSKEPNLQNIPNPTKEPGTLLEKYPIKNVFTHTWFGGCLYNVDYGGVEMRVMASLSESRSMIKMFTDDLDLHTYTASKLYNVSMEEVTSFQRQRAKTANWTFLFGGTWVTIMRDYGFSEEEAKKLESGWLAVFPDVTRFGKYAVEKTRELGYSESAFGRRRYIPFIKNADPLQISMAERRAKNHPIQSTANDLLLMSLNAIRDIGKLHNMQSKSLNTVHDSMLFDVYPGELENLHDLVGDVMVNIKDYAVEFFPSFDFNWLKVPLTIDAQVGTHYGSMKRYGG